MLRLPEFVEPRYLCAVEIADSLESRPASNAQLELVIVRGAGKADRLLWPTTRASFDDATATRAARQLSSWLKHLAAEASAADREDRPGRRRRAQAPDRRVQPDGDGLPARQVRAPAVRGPGGPHAGRGGPGLRRPLAELRRAERPGQPPGPRPDRRRRRAQQDGRPVRRTLGGAGHRRAGHPEGGRRLPAAGPGLPAGPHRLHGRGQRGRHHRLPAGDRGSLGRRQGQAGVHRQRPGGASPGSRTPTRTWRSSPSTSPTASTPRARPASPRAC